MAKYEVIHTCGHRVTHRLYGNSSRRKWELERLEREPCWECQKQALNEAAEEATINAGLIPLVGSEKQIAWANSIRLEQLAKVKDWRADHGEAVQRAIEAGRVGNERAQGDLLAIDGVIDSIEAETSAKFWIETRFLEGKYLLQKYMKLRARARNNAS